MFELENESDADGGATDGGDGGGNDNSAGVAGADGGSEFSLESWDGQRSSLPEANQAMFDKMNSGAEEAKRLALQSYLKGQFGESKAPEIDVPEKENLTREDIQDLIASQTRKQEMARRAGDFNNSFVELVGKPQSFGEATVAFSSREEVDAFRDFSKKLLGGGITPKQLLGVFMMDQIIQGNRDHAVRGFEKGLTKRSSIGTEKKLESKTQNREDGGRNDSSKKRGVSRTAEILKERNPKLYEDIMAGNVSFG